MNLQLIKLEDEIKTVERENMQQEYQQSKLQLLKKHKKKNWH